MKFHRPKARHTLVAIATTLFVLSAAPVVQAQSTPEPTGSEVVRTITVSGTGTVMITPDTASVSLGVETSNESLQEAQDEATRRLSTLTQTLKDAGVAPEDITTSSYNVYPVPEYDRDGNYKGIERYQVSSWLNVVVRDINSVGTILDQGVAAGANSVGGVYFYVDDTTEAANQARTAALEEARTKADQMATATGMTVVNVVSIRETSAPAPQEQQYMPAAMEDGMGGASKESMPVPVSTGQSSIVVTVEVVFQIEQAAGSN